MSTEERIVIEPVSYPTDARGLVIEPIGPDELPAQRNVHLVLTEPGGIRGNHYHRNGSEISLVFGPCLARYRQDGALHDFLVPEGQAYRFRIPPGIPHAFQNPGPGRMVILGFNTRAHDPATPDVVREELIPALSPYPCETFSELGFVRRFAPPASGSPYLHLECLFPR